jgi:hypothetical protein
MTEEERNLQSIAEYEATQNLPEIPSLYNQGPDLGFRYDSVVHLDPKEQNLIKHHRDNLDNDAMLNDDNSITTVRVQGVSGPPDENGNRWVHSVPSYDKGKLIPENELYDYWAQRGRINDFPKHAQKFTGTNDKHPANVMAKKLHHIIEKDMRKRDFGAWDRHELANETIVDQITKKKGAIRNRTPADTAKNYAGARDYTQRLAESMPNGTKWLSKPISALGAVGYQALDFMTDVPRDGVYDAGRDALFDLGGNLAGVVGANKYNDEKISDTVKRGLDYGYRK